MAVRVRPFSERGNNTILMIYPLLSYNHYIQFLYKINIFYNLLYNTEIATQSQCVVLMNGATTSLKYPKSDLKADSKGTREDTKLFTYDHSIFSHLIGDPHYKDQAAVFDTLGTGVLNNAFCGFNACILAYGQTGSGKTHSIMGSPSDPGLSPRLCNAMFSRISANTDTNITYGVEISYMEIYNEKVFDLLAVSSKRGGSEGPGLRVREHALYGPYVEGLTKLAVVNFDSINTLMKEGNKVVFCIFIY